MFVHIYSENVVPNSLMNLFQLKYMLQMGPIPKTEISAMRVKNFTPPIRPIIATV